MSNPFQYSENGGADNTNRTDQQQFFLSSNRLAGNAANNNSRIPSSPHSDTATQPSSNPPSVGQLQRRPLSVPPGSGAAILDHSYQRGGSDFLQTDFPIRRQHQQQTIAEVEELDESGSGTSNEPPQKRMKRENSKEDDPELVMLVGGDDPSEKMPASESPKPIGPQSQQQQQATPASVGCFGDTNSETQSPMKAPLSVQDDQLLQQQQPKTALQQEEERQREQLLRQQRREPVLLDCNALERAMLPPKVDEPSPLEQFLLGQTLLTRLLPFFELAEREAQRRERGKLNLPVKELHWAQGVLNVTFSSYPLPVGNNPTNSDEPAPVKHCLVRLQLFVCPKEFRLLAKLEYTGQYCPAEWDVKIFERFFASQVVRMQNEMAVFAFINLCRLSSPPIFASIAQVMQAQMEPQNYPWRIELELLHIVQDEQATAQQQQQQANAKSNLGPQFRVRESIVVAHMCKSFVFILYLRPNNGNATSGTSPSPALPASRPVRMGNQQKNLHPDRRQIFMRYSIESNELALYNQGQMSAENEQIANVLKTQTEQVNKQNEDGMEAAQKCSIWPCIQALLEGQHQQQNQQ